MSPTSIAANGNATRTNGVDNAMSIPPKCQVLVIGGGPGGSYAASALAHEGLDVVLLEAEVFPRYHIGESMLASMRHFLRFIDLDTTFDSYGFTKKVGAAFKFNSQKREGYTDFLEAGGPDNYAWNVVRSEADDLMFRHAAKCGAKVFDGVKVTDIQFISIDSASNPNSTAESNGKGGEKADLQGKRPISATWVRKSAPSQSGTEETTGTISFDYLVDASGRAGILSSRYLKNRNFNQGLKNVASWGYWQGAGVYARGTSRENAPFFEALKDESGWAWHIPLHDGTASVGIVMNQDIATAKKKETTPTPSAREFYLEQLKLAPSLCSILHSDPDSNPTSLSESSLNGKGIWTKEVKETEEIEEKAVLVSEVKSASDYSYSASSYSLPFARIVGDAGCFIDPYFSSGVHLAFSSALTAATTICASLRGDCTEVQAQEWHDKKVGVGYTRFLLVVLSAYKQIRAQDQPVLSDFAEDNFDRAFAHFRPIIQGKADVSNKLSQEELTKTLDFCVDAFEPTVTEERASVLKKLHDLSLSSQVPTAAAAAAQSNEHDSTTDKLDTKAKKKFSSTKALVADVSAHLDEEEQRILRHIRARQMLRTEDILNIDSFSADVIDGFTPRLERGSLGLGKVAAA